jgi:hypothetical protein
MSNLETNNESGPANPISDQEIQQFSTELQGMSSPTMTIAREAMTRAVDAIQAHADKAIASQVGTPEEVKRLGDLLTGTDKSDRPK